MKFPNLSTIFSSLSLSSAQLESIGTTISGAIGSVPSAAKTLLETLRGSMGNADLIRDVSVKVEELGNVPPGALSIINALPGATDPVTYQNEITAIENLYLAQTSTIASWL